MDSAIKRNKGKIILVVIVLLVITIPVLWFVFVPSDDTGVPTGGFQIEESIDMSYSEWNIGTNYQWTKVVEGVDGEIKVQDSNIGMIAKATRNFNAIDIGEIKMDIRALSTSRNYFAMEFRAGGTTLFKLERKVVTLTFVVLSDMAITLYDMDTTFKTIEIFFDLSDGSNGKVSVDVDGVTVINDYSFDPNNMDIDNIYMHTSTKIYKSQTGIKFTHLYNLE